MLRLARIAALSFLVHSILLTAVYVVGAHLPSGGVLDVISEHRTLTDFGLGITLRLPTREAVFAPDRRRYVTIERRAGTQAVDECWLWHLGSPNSTLLFQEAAGTLLGLPSWSTDGRMIAYLRQADEHMTVVIFDLAARQVIAEIDAAYPLLPTLVWWPDHSRLLTSALIDGQYDLVTLRIPDGRMTALSSTPHNETFPLITPDGGTILFTSSALGTLDVYAMSSSGAEVRPLVVGSALYTAHGLSPDGRWLSVVRLSAERGLEGLRFDRWRGVLLPAFPLPPAAQLGWW